VGFAVKDAMALLDDGHPDGLGQMALAGAGRAEEEPVLVLGDEAAGRQLEDEPAIELPIEVEIEGVQRLAHVTEAGLFEAAVEQPVLASKELVTDERGEEVDRGEVLGLRLQQPWLQAGGHAGAAKLTQGALEFEDVHELASWALRAMTSR
jgi:hypothetical protein